MFTNPFPGAFGLDIGDLSIKAVLLKNVSYLRRTASYEPLVIRATKIPRGLIVNGSIQEPEKVRQYIAHLLHGGGRADKPIRGQWVVASLPDVQGFLKRIDIDKGPDDILEEDVRYNAKRHIPFDEDDYYLDWQLIPGNERKETSSILLGAIPKKISDMYTYLLESLGLGIVAFDIEPLAIARTLITAQKVYTGEARAILDIGATRSSVTIYDHDHIQLSISIPYSGDLVTSTIAQKLNLSPEAAEELKIRVGLEYRQGDDACWSIITGLVDDLITQVDRAIQFYYSHFSLTNNITHITMCGGGAMMKRLDRVLSLKLKITARHGHVWKNLALRKAAPLSDDASLSYATAIGLALRAADNPFLAHDTL